MTKTYEDKLSEFKYIITLLDFDSYHHKYRHWLFKNYGYLTEQTCSFEDCTEGSRSKLSQDLSQWILEDASSFGEICRRHHIDFFHPVVRDVYFDNLFYAHGHVGNWATVFIKHTDRAHNNSIQQYYFMLEDQLTAFIDYLPKNVCVLDNNQYPFN